MSNNFHVWVDNGTANTLLTATELSNDEQKQDGFISGQPASSKRVNSMLRQNSLVATAIMNALLPDSSFDLSSSEEDIKNALINYFGQYVVGGKYDSDTLTLTLTLKNNTEISIPLSTILDKTVAKASADEDGNNIVDTYATKAALNSNYYSKSEIDSGVVATLITVNNQKLKFFIGTQDAYDALSDKSNIFGIITDDTTKSELEDLIAEVNEHETTLANHTSVLSSLSNSVTANEASINELSSKVTTNTNNIATNTQTIESHTSTIALHTSSISNLENQIKNYARQYSATITGGSGTLIAPLLNNAIYFFALRLDNASSADVVYSGVLMHKDSDHKSICGVLNWSLEIYGSNVSLTYIADASSVQETLYLSIYYVGSVDKFL